MVRDQRDPARVGAALLNELHALRVDGFVDEPTACDAADCLHRYRISDVQSEGPLERYGDPRDYKVEVETIVRRIPTRRELREMPIERFELMGGGRVPGPRIVPKPKPDGGRIHG